MLIHSSNGVEIHVTSISWPVAGQLAGFVHWSALIAPGGFVAVDWLHCVNYRVHFTHPGTCSGCSFSSFLLVIAGWQVHQALTRRRMTSEGRNDALEQEQAQNTEVMLDLDSKLGGLYILICSGGSRSLPCCFLTCRAESWRGAVCFAPCCAVSSGHSASWYEQQLMSAHIWPVGFTCDLTRLLTCRCVHTAGFGGCWASGSHRRRPSSTPRFPVLGARTSPAASVCAGSPACCCPSCPAGCRAPWATRCPAALGAPSPQVWMVVYLVNTP